MDHPVLDGLVDQVRMAVRGEDDDGRSGISDDLSGGGQTVEARHLNIHEYDVRKCAATDFNGMMPIMDHGDNVVTQRFKLR